MEYLVLPFVEIEIRFGTLGNKFDSCIDKKYFDHIHSALCSSTWVCVTESKTKETINKNIKMIEGSGIIMKENVFTKTLQLDNSPFDIRVSVNQEINLNFYTFTEHTLVREKHRKTFLSDNFKYDLTIVKETINNVTKEKYELELELLVNENTMNWNSEYINDFIECKVYDIMNIVEPMERKQFKLKLF